MADKVSHHGGMTSVHSESKLAHSGKPADTAIGWMKHAAMAPMKHAGTTDAKHHSHANGGLLRGLNSR